MILVECRPDEALVKTLTSSKDIMHCGNKSGVCRRLSKKYRGSIGVVDFDPGSAQPPYIRKLWASGRYRRLDDLIILYDPVRDNHVIMLYPRLEEWILDAAKKAGVKPNKYSLPDDGNRLHREINTRLSNFEKLLTELTGKSQKLAMLRKILERPDSFTTNDG